MLMTEGEAKKKWCPHARYTADEEDNSASNRWCGDKAPKECLCIATNCMAWRWGYERNFGGDLDRTTDFKSGLRTGYCGAFGKPVNP
ncbi:hypothetical protein [Azospirillum argentinense]